MGRDRNFPAFFSKVHAKNFTPHWGIIGSLIIVIFMVVSLPIEDVASAADIMFLLLFLQVNLAMISLRKKRPDLRRGFVTPLYPWLTIAGIGMLLFLALYMFAYSIIAWIVTVLWIAAGLGVYTFYSSRREVEHIKKLDSLERIERKEYSILLCLSNPQSVKSLTNIALSIARKYSGEIIVLHVIEVREGQPLVAGYEETARARPLLDEAESLIMDAAIPCRSIIRVSHRISKGIIETESEENCNFVVMGRQQQITLLNKIFFSLMDSVIDKSPAEIAILHGAIQSDSVRTILVPFAPDIHTRLALEIAPAVAEFFNAELHFAIVVSPYLSRPEQELKIAEAREIIHEQNPAAKLSVVLNTEVVKGIIKKSKKADLILMGGKTGDFLELLLANSVAREITEKAACPVIWVKEYEERESFWSTFISSFRKQEGRHA
jgi:nucleotide-binding universal stress UspA family protein